MGWEIHAAHQRQILAAWVEGDPRGAKSEIAAAACERRKLLQRGARTERAAAAHEQRELQRRAEGGRCRAVRRERQRGTWTEGLRRPRPVGAGGVALGRRSQEMGQDKRFGRREGKVMGNFSDVGFGFSVSLGILSIS